jgi:hypothetical protein
VNKVTLRYVRHEDVERYLHEGWTITHDLQDCCHGQYAVLMLWPCDCPLTATNVRSIPDDGDPTPHVAVERRPDVIGGQHVNLPTAVAVFSDILGGTAVAWFDCDGEAVEVKRRVAHLLGGQGSATASLEMPMICAVSTGPLSRHRGRGSTCGLSGGHPGAEGRGCRAPGRARQIWGNGDPLPALFRDHTHRRRRHCCGRRDHEGQPHVPAVEPFANSP